MMRLAVTTLPLLATLLAPIAVSQDGAEFGQQAQPAKTAPVLMELRIYPVDGDHVRVDVVGVHLGGGGPRIIICSLASRHDWSPAERAEPVKIEPGELIPLGFLSDTEFRTGDFEKMATLPIALLPVAIHDQGRIVFGRAKTVRALVAEGAEWGGVGRTGHDGGDAVACDLPKLAISVVSTDSIPPEFGLDIRAWVHPPGQTLKLDKIQKAGAGAHDHGFDVYLSLGGGFGPRDQDQTAEELAVYVHLGRGEGAEARVWLRRVHSDATNGYCLAGRVTLLP